MNNVPAGIINIIRSQIHYVNDTVEMIESARIMGEMAGNPNRFISDLHTDRSNRLDAAFKRFDDFEMKCQLKGIDPNETYQLLGGKPEYPDFSLA